MSSTINVDDNNEIVNKNGTENDDDSVTIQPAEDDEEEKDNLCVICSEPWDVSGTHRVVTLKCGHIFGKSCIDKWVEQKKKCPYCNKLMTNDEIIPLYLNSSVNKKVIQQYKKKNEEQMQNVRKQLRLERKKRRNLENGLFALKTKIDKYLNNANPNPVPLAGSNAIPAIKKRKVMATDDTLSYDLSADSQLQSDDGIIEITEDNSDDTLNVLRSISKDIENIDFERPLEAVVASHKIPPIGKLKRYKHQYKIRRELDTHNTASKFDFLNDPSTIIFDNKKTGQLTIFNMINDAIMEVPLFAPNESRTMGNHLITATDLKSLNNGLSLTALVYVTSTDAYARVFDVRTNKVAFRYHLRAIASCCAFDAHDPYLMYYGLHGGTVEVLDIRRNGSPLNTISLTYDTTNANVITSVCATPNRGLLACHAKNGVYYCEAPQNPNAKVASLSNLFPLRTSVDYSFNIGYDSYSEIFAASFASVRTPSRNVDHFLFRANPVNFTDSLELLRTIAEPTITVPEIHQPSIFQTLGVEEVSFNSPTLLFSTGSKTENQAIISVDDEDEVVCIDPRIEAGNINTLLAYAKYKKVTVMDTNDGNVFQQLPSRHLYSLTCIRHLNHSFGHFFAQLSNDRFTLFNLS